jgi:hypothetical protein
MVDLSFSAPEWGVGGGNSDIKLPYAKTKVK